MLLLMSFPKLHFPELYLSFCDNGCVEIAMYIYLQGSLDLQKKKPLTVACARDSSPTSALRGLIDRGSNSRLAGSLTYRDRRGFTTAS